MVVAYMCEPKYRLEVRWRGDPARMGLPPPMANNYDQWVVMYTPFLARREPFFLSRSFHTRTHIVAKPHQETCNRHLLGLASSSIGHPRDRPGRKFDYKSAHARAIRKLYLATFMQGPSNPMFYLGTSR